MTEIKELPIEIRNMIFMFLSHPTAQMIKDSYKVFDYGLAGMHRIFIIKATNLREKRVHIDKMINPTLKGPKYWNAGVRRDHLLRKRAFQLETIVHISSGL